MSPFQAQYPLSPKKFTKKMISRIPDSIIYSIILGAFSAVGSIFLSGEYPSFETALTSFFSAAIVVFVLLIALFAWYYKTYIRLYFYEGGENFITIKKGVFAPKEIHVQYQKVQDVYVDQDILDRIMGLYDVHIASATATSGMEAHIDGVEKDVAEGLKNFFLAKIQGAAVPSAPTGMPAVPAPEFSGDISSTNYPIQPAWLPKTIFGVLLSSILTALFLAIIIWAKLEDDATFPFFALYAVTIVVSFVLQTLYYVLWKGNYRFTFAPEYIEFHTGVIAQQDRHLPYKSIQDVNVTRSILDRIFGLADVVIENAAQVTIQTRYGARSMTQGVRIVGQTPETAAKITEALKQTILSKDSSRMGL